MNNIYGPITSRRFGQSLGISIVSNPGEKICNLDCAYCELGHTRDIPAEYGEYISVDDILSQLEHFMQNNSQPIDVLTITGFGEPTLNCHINEIARRIKTKYPSYDLLLLTNATHLDKPEVIEALQYFDRIVPSLDAISEDVFAKINKPIYGGITAAGIFNNIYNARRIFSGSLEIEILFCKGINDGEEELRLLKDACTKIRPDKIWINTIDRRPAYRDTVGIDGQTVAKLQQYFAECIKS